ncbi:hypothetical protein PH586_22050 [Pseudomonas sp. SA3-5]|uniref:Uncharacterized protein n=1 Tax=Pseudomonas aestuarii TaxID=3018340 RepID=A0ABT4XLK5_9PSED|nr:hypothetical protein [Pseudomonas aestuarii]MDA7089067.1 hypothetical protein [Pseudomonas aestuarii]
MKKTLYVSMTMPLLALSLHAEANLITLEAMKFYAEECANQGGTSYVSNDQGTTWQPLDYQETAYALKHAKSVALMDATMSGQRASAAELDQYLAEHAKSQATKLEEARTLHCEH